MRRILWNKENVQETLCYSQYSWHHKFSLVFFFMSADSSLISFFVIEFRMSCKLAPYFLHLRIVLSTVHIVCIPYIVPRTNRFTMAHYTLGFRLNSTVVKTKVVSDWADCVMECATEICCRSINFRKKITSENQSNCEMLHNVVYNTSEILLEKNSSYNYVYLVNPQKVWLRSEITYWLFNKQHMLSTPQKLKEQKTCC